MKTLVIASLVMLSAATAVAAEAVSSATLQGMGLEKMQQLSDADGSTVRGKGPFDSRFFSIAPIPRSGGAFSVPSFTNNFSSHFTNFPGFGGGLTPPAGTTPPATPPAGTTPGLGSVPGLGNFFGSLNL